MKVNTRAGIKVWALYDSHSYLEVGLWLALKKSNTHQTLKYMYALWSIIIMTN